MRIVRIALGAVASGVGIIFLVSPAAAQKGGKGSGKEITQNPKNYIVRRQGDYKTLVSGKINSAQKVSADWRSQRILNGQMLLGECNVCKQEISRIRANPATPSQQYDRLDSFSRLCDEYIAEAQTQLQVTQEAYKDPKLLAAVIVKLKPKDRQDFVDAMRDAESAEDNLRFDRKQVVSGATDASYGYIASFLDRIKNALLSAPALAHEVLIIDKKIMRDEEERHNPKGKKGGGTKGGKAGVPEALSPPDIAAIKAIELCAVPVSRAAKAVFRSNTDYGSIDPYCHNVVLYSVDANGNEKGHFRVAYVKSLWASHASRVKRFGGLTKMKSDILAGVYDLWCEQIIPGQPVKKGTPITGITIEDSSPAPIALPAL